MLSNLNRAVLKLTELIIRGPVPVFVTSKVNPLNEPIRFALKLKLEEDSVIMQPFGEALKIVLSGENDKVKEATNKIKSKYLTFFFITELKFDKC
jgi:hypothetical protein